MTESKTDLAINPATAVLDEGDMKQLGLLPSDLDRVHEIRATLEDVSPSSVQGYGKDASAKTTQFSSELLDQVRNRDLDVTGDHTLRRDDVAFQALHHQSLRISATKS